MVLGVGREACSRVISPLVSEQGLARSSAMLGISLGLGSPTFRPWTASHLWSVKNQAGTVQEVSGGPVGEVSSVFTAAPHHSCYCLKSASCQISVLDSHRSWNPIVLESSIPSTPTPAAHGIIVFHETSPWSQKGWGPVLKSIGPVNDKPSAIGLSCNLPTTYKKEEKQIAWGIPSSWGVVAAGTSSMWTVRGWRPGTEN